MIDLNAIKVAIGQLNPKLEIKTGDKIDESINMRDLNYSQIVVLFQPSDKNPDLITSEIKKLSKQKDSSKKSTIASITLSPYLGFVKSPELPGTRVNLEFAVTNKIEEPIVVKGVDASLNNDQLHFKSFFKINSDNSREPDFSTRLPIIINSKGSGRLSVVLENFSKWLVKEGQLQGKLRVLLGNHRIIQEKFIFRVNSEMINTLEGLAKVSSENKVAIVFDAMIES